MILIRNVIKFKILDVSEDKSEIKSASKERLKVKNKKPDELFEDKFWNFLYGTNEFFKINCEREARVQFDLGGNIKNRHVDIITECKYSKLYIECTIDTDPDKKVHSTISKFSEYQKYIEEKDKNAIQIFFYNQELSKGLQDSLKNAGVKFVHEKAIDYFSELALDYPTLAYYQFLSFIFSHEKPEKSQIIKRLNDKNFIIPVQGNNAIKYMFSHSLNNLFLFQLFRTENEFNWCKSTF